MKQEIPDEWWKDSYFFGKRYYDPDNSCEGYLPSRKEGLEERTIRESIGVEKLLGLGNGSKILDVPCGYGRHSIFLSGRGYEVTGLDIDKEHLKKAVWDSKEKKADVRFLERDMRDIGSDLYGKFDATINMLYSFGFFKEEGENIQTMNEFYKSLKPSGQLLIHSDVSPEMIKNKTTKLCDIRNLPGNRLLIILENYNPDSKRMEGSWETTDQIGNVIYPRAFYSVRIYSAGEYESMAVEAGFKHIEIYGSFNGEKFNNKSEEMIMVARK